MLINLSESGGPAGAIYGFLMVWIGMLCTYLCLSEMASMQVNVPIYSIQRLTSSEKRAPTSGGQYQ